MATPSASTADQEAAIKKRVITHMNKDHTADLAYYLRAYNGLTAAEAGTPQLLDMVLDSMTINSASGIHTVALTAPPLASLRGSREKLVEMSHAAQRKLGISDEIKIDIFAPPAGFDIVVFGAVVFYWVCLFTRGLVRPGTPVWRFWDAVFPYGAPGYLWTVGALFVPVLVIHLTEIWWMTRTRLARHGVVPGSKVWLLWAGSTFFEGAPAFRRFDRLVEGERRRRESSQH